MKKNCLLITLNFLFILTLFFPSNLLADEPEDSPENGDASVEAVESGDSEESDDTDDFDDSDESMEESEKKWSISGYVESENYFDIGANSSASLTANSSDDESTVQKVELHPKLKLMYGSETLYAKAVLHGYLYPSGGNNAATNYENRLVVPELYMGIVFSDFDVKAGKQVIKWGTANTINPTSYFNPFDLSESLLKEEEELYRGVPALSSVILLGDFSLQLVFIPVHTPSRLAKTGSEWELRFPTLTVTNPVGSGTVAVPVRFEDNASGLAYDPANMGYGARFSGTGMGVDFSVSAYHGPDRDVLLFPKTLLDLGDPVSFEIVMTPQYRKVTSFGFDLEFTLDDFTIYGEAAFSYNKSAVTDMQKLNKYSAGIEETGYLYYAGGVSWLFDDNFKIILEYLQGIYLWEKDRYMAPLLSNLLSFSVDKKLLDESLILKLNGLFNTSDYCWLLMPVVGWDFRNNLMVEVQAAFFQGDDDTLFGSYNSRDNLSVKVKYHF